MINIRFIIQSLSAVQLRNHKSNAKIFNYLSNHLHVNISTFKDNNKASPSDAKRKRDDKSTSRSPE